jgi:hypothetical protein
LEKTGCEHVKVAA